MAVEDVNATQLIFKVAEELKKEQFVQPPEWAVFVKTGVNRERRPTQDNWWHIRAAAILRKLFVLGPIGACKLRKQFGGRKNRGHKPDKFFAGSGNIIRTILQQLEKAGLAKQVEKEVHKGRIVTPKGHKLLSQSSIKILKENPYEPLITREFTVSKTETKKEVKEMAKEAVREVTIEAVKGGNETSEEKPKPKKKTVKRKTAKKKEDKEPETAEEEPKKETPAEEPEKTAENHDKKEVESTEIKE